MNYRDTIPKTLLEKFDSTGLHGVKARLDIGIYSGKKKKYATLYVDQCTNEREAAASGREEARAIEALSISRSAISIASEALRITRSERTIAIIAAIAAVAAAALTAYIAYITSTSVP